MKKVIIEEETTTTIQLNKVPENTPIFAKRDGLLKGMIIHERHHKDSNEVYDDRHGWILRLGGSVGSTGFHKTRRACIESCSEYGYTFHVE